jgi:opacity protein-like surface antigen
LPGSSITTARDRCYVAVVRYSHAWLLALLVLLAPSTADADTDGQVEVVSGVAIPESGETSGNLDYTDQVGTSFKLGVRAGVSIRSGHVVFGPEAGVDHTWYSSLEDEGFELSRVRYLAGARVGVALDDGWLLFVRAAAGTERVDVSFPDLQAALCRRESSSDWGAAWEVGVGVGKRVDRFTFGLQVGWAKGYHGDHVPMCTPGVLPPGVTVDVLDYDSLDVDVLGAVSVSF